MPFVSIYLTTDSLQHLNLAQLRHNLLRRKSLPSHLLSPFQFDNGKIFYTLKEAQVVIKKWRKHYNTKRPHSSLG
jgi:transposase InsO family protein